MEQDDRSFRVCPKAWKDYIEGTQTIGMIAMLMKIDAEPLAPPSDQLCDYDRVRRALEYMTTRWRVQPSLDDVAAHIGLSPSHFHHLFRRVEA